MGMISHLSIKHKITSIAMATVVIVLLIVSAVFVTTEYFSFRRKMVEDLSFLSEVAATHSAGSLMQSDRSTADKILAGFKTHSDILAAYILDPQGRVFAHYFRNPLSVGREQQIAEVEEAAVVLKPGTDKYQYENNYLSYCRPIVSGNSNLGTFLLHADMSSLYSRMALYIGIGVLVMLVASFIAYVIASKLQRVISSPILSMAETMKIVSNEKKYSVRQKKVSNDELGTLVDGFNDMLSKIEKRDSELEQHKHHLEEQVQDRTRELSKINEDLKTAVAELKVAKESAEAANVLKSQFLANMSHELRTPLNHVIGFTEIVLNQSFGELNDTQQDYLSDTLASSKHLLALINDILDLAKIEAGEEQLEISEVPVKKTLESSLSLVKAKSIRHKIDLSNTTNGIPEIFHADERKFKHVLYNLLSNAMKFTPDGGSVSLHAKLVDYASVSHMTPDRSEIEKYFSRSAVEFSQFMYPPKSGIQFSVSDTGIGVKKEDQNRIFNPFEQADGSSTRKFEGTGLGLSVTKGIVEMHGGAIWLESGGVNKGATFHFVLPILEKSELIS